MKRIFILNFVAIFFFLTPNVGNAKDTARLIMATKGEHTAFFLPLLHIPSTIENDDYRVNIVEKIFQRASIVYDESAHRSHIYPYAALPCLNENKMSSSIRKKLHNKYMEIKEFDSYVFPDLSILQEFEFAKLMVVIFGPIEPNMSNLPVAFVLHQGQVTTVLAKKFGVNINSIESMNDFHKSYCDLSTLEKEDVVEDVLAGFANSIIEEPKLSQEYAKALSHVKKVLNKVEVCRTVKCQVHSKKIFRSLERRGTTKFFLNYRNSLWLRKIQEVQNTEHVPFYGLGIRHFYSSKNGLGLIEMLRAEGFSMRIIKTLDDVPKNILDRIPIQAQ